jgi:hypothetical protein
MSCCYCLFGWNKSELKKKKKKMAKIDRHSIMVNDNLAVKVRVNSIKKNAYVVYRSKSKKLDAISDLNASPSRDFRSTIAPISEAMPYSAAISAGRNSIADLKRWDSRKSHRVSKKYAKSSNSKSKKIINFLHPPPAE